MDSKPPFLMKHEKLTRYPAPRTLAACLSEHQGPPTAVLIGFPCVCRPLSGIRHLARVICWEGFNRLHLPLPNPPHRNRSPAPSPISLLLETERPGGLLACRRLASPLSDGPRPVVNGDGNHAVAAWNFQSHDDQPFPQVSGKTLFKLEIGGVFCFVGARSRSLMSYGRRAQRIERVLTI